MCFDESLKIVRFSAGRCLHKGNSPFPALSQPGHFGGNEALGNLLAILPVTVSGGNKPLLRINVTHNSSTFR